MGSEGSSKKKRYHSDAEEQTDDVERKSRRRERKEESSKRSDSRRDKKDKEKSKSSRTSRKSDEGLLLWHVSCFASIWFIWLERNRHIFEVKDNNIGSFKDHLKIDKHFLSPNPKAFKLLLLGRPQLQLETHHLFHPNDIV
ncbi:uncharacterized protein LOC18443224 isoform X3 [Amborella trichopoda]|uniref:uncharacterized protein LOC18443224 isoform X3 n=1 Tax=Amborella trichopoda TaxID=13333 RepID=UPI0009C15FE0|nr:uncharacterized protein LOC18443224 isoform X3 [Amborella trichopoda]|eukprot:XP_020528426.1 uncharacterized protein LOC18443224 isoform X3 [Amborella trichopoda]